ncbi:MAG: Holliday junction branch migration protein RuvA [Candidatus Uhrbacteria bacterium]|nr:Holliday junction branch migration protein RuvA [Candidatus Uhrbacteria bacterium]
MIAYLEGAVRSVRPGRLVLLVGGIGYEVFAVGFDAEVDTALQLHIHDYVREDRRELYGFTDRPTQELFERLIDISGVGTKLAQKILSVGTRDDIADRILKGDLGFLTSISGVGKKTAQKIILELKGVLVQEDDRIEDADTLDALMSLGYPRNHCIEIIRQVNGNTLEEKIKDALRLLG